MKLKLRNIINYLQCHRWVIVISLILLAAVSVITTILYQKYVISESLSKNTGEYVVLLHGLGQSSVSMQKIGYQLAKNNYRVINVNYPTREDTIPNLVESYLVPEIYQNYTDTTSSINFVTHSLGGIMTRYFLSKHTLENLNHVIMLAPPNQGSKTADFFSDNEIVEYIMGPVVSQLTTDPESFVNSISPPDYQIAVIAAQYDWVVTEEQTQLQQMSDFIIGDSQHTFIIFADDIIDEIIHYLGNGTFIK